MNKSILLGTVTQTPNISIMDNGSKVANYRLAIAKEGKKKCDKIACTAFGPHADFAETMLESGTKLLVTGHLQCNNYTNKYGEKIYTTEVIVEAQELV